MKLEFKHVTAYLPYSAKGLQVMMGSFIADPDTEKEIDLNIHNITCFTSKKIYRQISCKLILRPLSDLTRDNIVRLKLFVNADKEYLISNPLGCDYSDFSYLLSEHFDVFGLIDSGLAVDVNTLKAESC